jgi:hypothetical protein
MNIAKRMILLICLSAAGLLAIGLVGLFQMNTIHEQLDETGTNVVPSLIKLAEAENTFMSLRTQVLYHLLMEDTASLAEQDRTLEHTRQQLETALNGYQAFVSDAKDQQQQGIAGQVPSRDSAVSGQIPAEPQAGSRQPDACQSGNAVGPAAEQKPEKPHRLQ